MRLRLQFRRYRLPFRSPVRTAHGMWAEREGLLVRMECDPTGRSVKNADSESDGPAAGVGFGEAAPIPHFGTETVEEDEAGCLALGEWTDAASIARVPVRLACLRNALTSALEGLGDVHNAEGQPAKPEFQLNARSSIGVAALLPAGRAALGQISPRAEVGFRVFKWKVGVGDIADELSLLDDVCAALPSGAKLRLDANGAWDRRQAERWLERCADRPVEFVEQPAFAHRGESAHQRRRTDDLLLGLAENFPTPIALDESLVGDGDIQRWLELGWRGVYVIKPSLLGDVQQSMASLAKARAKVVFSTALETALGARAALRTAFAWSGEPDAKGAAQPRALGFGVWPLFADVRFDGPSTAAFLRVEDVQRIRPDTIWNALS